MPNTYNDVQNVTEVGPETVEFPLLTAGALNADFLPAMDARPFAGLMLHVNGTFTGTLTIQGCKDVAFAAAETFGIGAQNISSANGAPTTTITTPGIYYVPCAANFIRVRMTAYTSGAAIGTADFSTTEVPFSVVGIPFGSFVGLLPNASTTNSIILYHKLISAATTNATSVKASTGKISQIVVGNTSATAKFLKLYNKASAPTVGTDIPVHTYFLPAVSFMTVNITDFLMSFNVGIAYAITTLIADSDTTAVAANDVVVNMMYI